MTRIGMRNYIIFMALCGSKATHGYAPFQVMTQWQMTMLESCWFGVELPSPWEHKVVQTSG